MLEINEEIQIDENELQFDAVLAGGPGGQNVNKLATAVQLRFNIEESDLPQDVKTRLYQLAGGRVNKEGVLIIQARQYRTQEQNRFDATERFVELLRQAAEKPKERKATKPTTTAKARRLSEKKKRGQLKRWRSYDPDEWE